MYDSRLMKTQSLFINSIKLKALAKTAHKELSVLNANP